MKLKIKSFKGKLPSCLSETIGYEIEHIDSQGRYFIYISDSDEYVRIDDIENCPHLNGGSWEIVD